MSIRLPSDNAIVFIDCAYTRSILNILCLLLQIIKGNNNKN